MIVAGSGLQPRSCELPHTNGCGVKTMLSTFQVKVTVQLDWFVQPSVAVKVKLCVRMQPLVRIAPATQSTVGFGSQLSVMVTDDLANAQFGVPTGGLHPRLMFVGQPLKTGGVVSCNVINWSQVLVLPQESVAFQVRVITLGQIPLVATSVRSE